MTARYINLHFTLLLLTDGQRTDINYRIINIAHLLLTRVKTVKSRRYALPGGRLK